MKRKGTVGCRAVGDGLGGTEAGAISPASVLLFVLFVQVRVKASVFSNAGFEYMPSG